MYVCVCKYRNYDVYSHLAFDGGDVPHALGVVPPEAAEHGGVAQLHLAEIAYHWQIQHLIPCTGRRLMYA